MAENKTKQTSESVTDFINSVENEQKRADSHVILELMKKASGEEPKMWGASIIGFGFVNITSNAGRKVEWFRIGFSPRKANLSLYISGNISHYADYLARLGKHKTGGGCLYINKLADIDMKVLKELIEVSLKKDYFPK